MPEGRTGRWRPPPPPPPALACTLEAPPLFALQERKKSPNRLVVDDAVNQDDNSVVTLHPKTMETLELFRGDTVLLKARPLRCCCVAAWVSPGGECLDVLPLVDSACSYPGSAAAYGAAWVLCQLVAAAPPHPHTAAGQEAQGHGVHRAGRRHCGGGQDSHEQGGGWLLCRVGCVS